MTNPNVDRASAPKKKTTKSKPAKKKASKKP
jgi:hypothetical protein